MSAGEALTEPRMVALQASDWTAKRVVEAIAGERFFHWLHDLRRAWGGRGYETEATRRV